MNHLEHFDSTYLLLFDSKHFSNVVYNETRTSDWNYHENVLRESEFEKLEDHMPNNKKHSTMTVDDGTECICVTRNVTKILRGQPIPNWMQ